MHINPITVLLHQRKLKREEPPIHLPVQVHINLNQKSWVPVVVLAQIWLDISQEKRHYQLVKKLKPSRAIWQLTQTGFRPIGNYIPKLCSRYVPEEPKIEFVDIDFFPEKKYQLFDEVKPSLEKILNALKEKCAGFNIFFDEEELRTLGMMTGKLIRPDRFFKVGCVFSMIVVSMLPSERRISL